MRAAALVSRLRAGVNTGSPRIVDARGCVPGIHRGGSAGARGYRGQKEHERANGAMICIIRSRNGLPACAA
jgi:hypothetical protein